MQLALVTPPAPPALPAGIDLRCCDTVEMLASITERAHLIVADPPWRYSQAHGASTPEDHFECLSTDKIAEHINAASLVGSRLALWITGALVGEWELKRLKWGSVVTEGAWVKSGEGDAGHFGQGYHWAGCAEFVRIYTLQGSVCRRDEPVRNAWIEAPTQHSRKPVGWQVQWIRKWVPEGGLVVDLYAGLGSVAEAVILAGGERRYIGAEISPKRHSDARALLAQVRRPEVLRAQ